MRALIAGAGSVGRFIAKELIQRGHEIILIDKSAESMRIASVDADWILADACSPKSLEEAGVRQCDVVVAATGDDKVNLVISLLAKTEYAVPKTVARINNPKTNGCSTTHGELMFLFHLMYYDCFGRRSSIR